MAESDRARRRMEAFDDGESSDDELQFSPRRVSKESERGVERKIYKESVSYEAATTSESEGEESDGAESDTFLASRYVKYGSSDADEGQVPFDVPEEERAAVDEQQMTLGERIKLRTFGIGAKPKTLKRENVNNVERRSDRSGSREDVSRKRKRDNKNRPAEVTSKKPVGRFRQVVEVPKNRARDPRFDNLSGKLNIDLFKKAYSFLDDYKDNEIDVLKQAVKSEKNSKKRAKMQGILTTMQQKRGEEKRQERVRQLVAQKKREERAAVAAGKNAYYMKRRDIKRLELEDRFKELESSGKLDKYMAKRRKKNANKDHRWLPRTRKDTGED